MDEIIFPWLHCTNQIIAQEINIQDIGFDLRLDSDFW